MDEILASIRRILAEDEHTVTRAPLPARASSDVLDLTEVLNEDGTVRHIAPIKLIAPGSPPPALPDGRIEPAAPRPDSATAPPQLISPVASDAVAASFARLAGASHNGDERSLDELVRETLRPMLQAWLDQHLPELVDRLVRAELARLVGNRPAAP